MRKKRSIFAQISEPSLAEIYRRYLVQQGSLSGSVMRNETDAESDIDVLVAFEAGHAPGFGFARLQREFSALFGQPMDLRTCRSLSRYFRNQVVQEAEVLYESAR
ncbi:MAG: nucleotidyltransferase family protein [Roseiflexus sp.]